MKLSELKILEGRMADMHLDMQEKLMAQLDTSNPQLSNMLLLRSPSFRYVE